MITKRIKQFFIAGFVCCSITAALTSCSDILETESNLVEFEKDNTLNHPTDSVYSVLGIVNKMQLIADRTVLLGELRGDLTEVTDAASADLKRLAAFDLSQPNKYNAVSDYYGVINNCNYYLAHIDTTLQRRGRVLFRAEYAAVKAYRAWTYLQLAQAYGNVPLVLQPVMTEQEAQQALNMPYSSLQDICNYFIEDLTPYARVELPDFGVIGDWDSDQFFIPMRALIGDLCLWAGRYQEAASWYHDYLNDEREPIQLSPHRITWPSVSEFLRPTDGYRVTTSTEAISLIPMEDRVFDGVVSDLENIFCSTRENNYYYQLTPSVAMRQLSAAQTYCIEYKTDTQTDTLYAPKVGLQEEILVGDLRLYSNYNMLSIGGQDAYSEYSSLRQTITKIWDDCVPTYRRTMVYLRYAEALNRAGLPQSAFAILKYGLCAENVVTRIDSLERVKAGSLIDFDANNFTKETTFGIHSLGSGDSEANEYYVLPMPQQALPSRQDTIAYQIPLVEDLIINEMALEGAFEGYRYYDLMRVALRRNDPAYLAKTIARRNGTTDAALESLLMDTKNWFLPLP